MTEHFNDLVYAYREIEAQEKLLRNSKEGINRRLCILKYGFAKGDTIRVTQEWAEKEAREADDTFYREAVVTVREVKIQHLTWDRNYISIVVDHYLRELYEEEEIQELVDIQKGK